MQQIARAAIFASLVFAMFAADLRAQTSASRKTPIKIITAVLISPV
jgi:hypothetical protein